MRKFILSSALCLFAFPAFATDLAMDAELGTDEAVVTAKLVEMGYEVRKSAMEDGKLEMYVVKNGKMGEVYVDTTSGKVTKLLLK
jgi:hypothetical protein